MAPRTFPQYEPLPVDASQIPYQQGFTISPLDKALQDAYKLQIQQATAQQEDIQAQQQKQQWEQQKAMSDALVQKYGDPNVQIDPMEAAKVIGETALRTGNAAQGLAAQRTWQDAKDQSALDQPLSEEDKQMFAPLLAKHGVDITKNPNITYRGAGKLIDALGKSYYATSVDNSMIRSNAQYESRSFPGLKAQIVKDDFGRVLSGPTQENEKKMHATFTAYNNLQDKLDMLRESFSRTDPNDPRNPEYAMQRSLINGMVTDFKNKDLFGANLTKNETDLTINKLPKVFSAYGVGIGTALMEVGLGRDPMDALNNMEMILNREFQQQAVENKFGELDTPNGSGLEMAAVRKARKNPIFGRFVDSAGVGQDVNAALTRSMPDMGGGQGTGPGVNLNGLSPEAAAYKKQKFEEHLRRLQNQGIQ